MERNRTLLPVIASLGAICLTTSASADELQAFSWTEIQGGVQWTSTNAPASKLMKPTGAISIGRYFYPEIAFRFQISGWTAKGFLDGNDYQWNYLTNNLDLMLNVTSFFDQWTCPMNIVAVTGIGLAYAWNSDEAETVARTTHHSVAWKDNAACSNKRFGIRFENDHNKPIGLSFEFDANALDDRFNLKENGSQDWQFTAMLGASYRFGRKMRKSPAEVAAEEPLAVAPQSDDSGVTITVNDTVWEEVPVKQMVKEQRPVKKSEAYQFRSQPSVYGRRVTTGANPDVLREVAQFMKDNPNSKITVIGYADRGTGTPRLNMYYATQRAENFKRELVKQYGVNVSNIIVEAKGDTEQPFPNDNDRNRCVIVIADGMRIVDSFEEVEVEKTVMQRVPKTSNE